MVGWAGLELAIVGRPTVLIKLPPHVLLEQWILSKGFTLVA